jgi:hypothetical protein
MLRLMSRGRAGFPGNSLEMRGIRCEDTRRKKGREMQAERHEMLMISNGWGTWIRTKIDGVRVLNYELTHPDARRRVSRKVLIFLDLTPSQSDIRRQQSDAP